MSNYIGLHLVVEKREDVEKIAPRVIELQNELNPTDGYPYKVEFHPFETKDGVGLTFCTYAKRLVDVALRVLDGVAASFPEMTLHAYISSEGPVCEGYISKNGEFVELECAKDENGNVLLDEDENVIFIEPEG